MGSYTGTIKFRDAQNASLASIAAAHNAVHAAMVGCGMLAVAPADYAGQAGTFVGASPGAGETLVQNPTTNVAVTLDGYRLYKHPTLAMWVLVYFKQVGSTAGYGTSTSWLARYSFRVAGELASGVLTPAKLSEDIYCIVEQSAEFTLTGVSAAFVPLVANCGADNFWIYSSGAFARFSGSASWYPSNEVPASIALGVFESGGSFGVASSWLQQQDGNSTYGPPSTTSGPVGTRYWTYDGASWPAADMCSFGGVQDPKTVTVAGNTRFARASKIISGVRRYFKFAIMQRGLISADGDILSLDLDGSGVKNYKACLGIGPSTPAMVYGQTNNNICSPLLPWGH